MLAGGLPERPIFGVSVNSLEIGEDEEGLYSTDVQAQEPPFYQFGSISLIYCDEWYQLDLSNYQLETGGVVGSSSTCKGAGDLSEQQAVTWMANHLQEDGFDTSVLDNPFPYLAASQ